MLQSARKVEARRLETYSNYQGMPDWLLDSESNLPIHAISVGSISKFLVALREGIPGEPNEMKFYGNKYNLADAQHTPTTHCPRNEESHRTN